MDPQTKRQFSRTLYEALDQQGYSSTRINQRADMIADVLETCLKKGDVFDDMVVAGSKGEGISKFFSSDLDIMLILSGIVCVEEGNGEERLVVVTNDYSTTKPGYVRLRTNSDFPYFEASIHSLCTPIDEAGNVYLDSKNAMLMLLNSRSHYHVEINGPALTLSVSSRDFCQRLSEQLPNFLKIDNLDTIVSMLGNIGNTETDFVIGLPFYSSTCLEKWLNRERSHEWPPKALQNKIASMIGYVVSVGNKSSQEPDKEWRISYTTAEKELVRKMTSGQVKLYVVLKLVQKERLKPVCKNFTSYMVKNLVFWVLEKSPMSMFTPDTLVDGIMSAFVMLKECLETKTLPCYMIAERNLLAERLGDEDIASLSAEVDKIIQEGYVFLNRNHKLSISMQLQFYCPDKAENYAQWILEIEDIVIKGVGQAFEIANENQYADEPRTFLDNVAIGIAFRLMQLICPEILTENRPDIGATRKWRIYVCVTCINTIKDVLS